MNISKLHIAHHLQSGQAFVVPGLGAFVPQRHRAVFGADGHVSAPVETFDIEQYIASVAEGEALVGSIMRREQVGSSEALSIAEIGSDEIRAEIDSTGRAEMADGVALRLNGSRLTLESASSSWLPELKLRPLAADNNNEEGRKEVVDEQREDFLRSLRRTASSAAAIAVIVLVAFVVSQLPTVRHSESKMATIGFETSVSANQSQGGTSLETPVILILNTPSDAVSSVEPQTAVSDEPQAAPGRYCYVVASLATAAEAQAFAAADNLKVLEKDGRYRVYALEGDDYSALAAAAKGIGLMERYPSAWICRR